MPGVTPAFEAPIALDESANGLLTPGAAETLPAPGSSGVTVAPPTVAAYRPAGAGYGALTEVVVEYAVAPVVAGAVEFIEVGPISVVLKGVSVLLPLDGADSYAAPGFSGPGGAAGPL